MNRNEFDSVMVNLKNAYGESKYSDIRCEEFFKKLYTLDADEFKEGVLSIIAQEERAPLLNTLTEKFKVQLSKSWEKFTDDLKKDVDCKLCRNKGFVQYNNEPYVTSVSKCKCILGKMWPSYPMFNHDRLKDVV